MKKRELMKWRENYANWEYPCVGEGLHLNVHFDEKDDVKRLGARWKPDPSGSGGHWWMPKTKLHQTCPIPDEEFWGSDGSGTIQHWLNNHKMIAGQFGHLSPGACEDAVREHSHAPALTVRLIGTSGDILTMTAYAGLDVVRLQGTAAASSDQWVPKAEARTTWDALIGCGYRKVVEETV